MYRKVLAEALMQNPAASARFSFSKEYNYRRALMTAEILQPDAAVLEIPESGEWDAEHCIRLCGTLTRHLPDMKLMILCPEDNPEACRRTEQALKDGLIRDYVFYDTSTQYLISKLEAL